MNWTEEEYRALARTQAGGASRRLPEAKPSKYRNQKVTVDGYLFDSKKEAARYNELLLLQKAGRCTLDQVHPVYPLRVNGILCGDYTADFLWTDTATGKQETEDVKSKASKTEAYQLRKKLVEAIYGITILET